MWLKHCVSKRQCIPSDSSKMNSGFHFFFISALATFTNPEGGILFVGKQSPRSHFALGSCHCSFMSPAVSMDSMNEEGGMPRSAKFTELVYLKENF